WEHASLGIFTEAGAEGGPLGIIVGIILDLILSIILIFLLAFILWLGVNLLVAAAALVFIPLFFLFRRSLRSITARSRRCRGDLGKSIIMAVYYTVIATVWFYIVLFIAHRIAFAMQWASQ
ncbi:MAG: hypothetical protein ACYTF1_16440, partial [Planctomycetota bacterium]